MKHPINVAPAARHSYTPGSLAQLYRGLDRVARARIDAEVDRVFFLKTGVHRTLDESSENRILVRQWLLIRDAVIARDQFERARAQAHRGLDAQAELEADLFRARLPAELKRRGLPKEISPALALKLIQLAHIAIGTVHHMEIFEDVWPHVVTVALEESGLPLAIVAGPLELIAGLAEIGEAHEAGSREAERHAFIHGFASHLVNGYVVNSLPSASWLGEYQVLGDKAARGLLSHMPPAVREKFLARYRGEQDRGKHMQNAIRDLGFGSEL